jgi:hypothetical protein
VAVAILERADNLGDGLHRVGRRAAVDAGMQIVVGALDGQLVVHQAAQPTQMVGISGANISVSHTTAASAFRRGGLVLTYSSMCSPPVSSSPSSRNFTFTGSLPVVFSRPSTALIWM